MAVGSGSGTSWKKALGAIKDTTTVGLVKVNSEYKNLDIAVVKATNHLEKLPKEKHVRTIFEAVSAQSPRADVVYCINGLSKRLSKTHNWAVALKTLIVIHRTLREVDPSFCEELIRYSVGSCLNLNLSQFMDDSSPNAWDYSAWVRTYALYLEERLQCFRVSRYDVARDKLKTENLDTPDLLEQLPDLQQLLARLLTCQPQGAAIYNVLIQYALSMVASESVKLYVAITDGTLNLVDKYFEMKRHDAVRALEIYRKGVQQAEALSQFFEVCRDLAFGRGQQFVKIQQPPASFMKVMEEYVKDSAQPIMIQWKENLKSIMLPAMSIRHQSNVAVNDSVDRCPQQIQNVTRTTIDRTDSPAATDTDRNTEPEILDEQDASEEKSDLPLQSNEVSKTPKNEDLVTPQIGDLLGFDDVTEEVSQIEEKNALSLAIVTTEPPQTRVNNFDSKNQSTGLELELFSAPSSNEAAVAGSKLGGGLDKLTLDSLYDSAIAQREDPNGAYCTGQVAHNPFMDAPCNQDPLSGSRNIAAPTNVQMAVMSQQQQAIYLQQQQQIISQDPKNNPFGNPFVTQNNAPHQGLDPFSGLI